MTRWACVMVGGAGQHLADAFNGRRSPAYPGNVGTRSGADHLHRLQHDIRATIHPWLHRNAAALRVVSAKFQVLNVMSSAGASVLALGYLLPLFYLPWSLFRGPRASANP